MPRRREGKGFSTDGMEESLADMDFDELRALKEQMEEERELRALKEELGRMKVNATGGFKNAPTAPQAEGVGMSMWYKSGIIVLMFLGTIVLATWMRGKREAFHVRVVEDPPYTPPIIVIEGWTAKNARRVNGVYHLRQERLRGRPVWEKRAPGGANSQSYLLFDECGSWLLSHDPTGGGPSCDGWAYSNDCSAPWRCGRRWKVFTGRGGWWDVDRPFHVTALWQDDFHPDACSAEDEAALAARFAPMDVVLPWVNGSDPIWREARWAACTDWLWRWAWPSALRLRRTSAARCMAKKRADGTLQENCTMPGQAGCEVRPSCFWTFADELCGRPGNSTEDPELLRFALRAVERNLPWHTGRVVLILPRGQRPPWLKEHNRLHIVEREALLQAAMSSPAFVVKSSKPRKNVHGYLPDRIYHDYAVHSALPFLPKVSPILLVLEPGLLLTQPLGPCRLFTHSGGLRLFGTPASSHYQFPSHDPFGELDLSITATNLKQWGRFLANDKTDEGPRSVSEGVVYYLPSRAPLLLNVTVLREVWAGIAEGLSTTMGMPVLEPNVLNIVGFHHSIIADRARRAKLHASQVSTRAIQAHFSAEAKQKQRERQKAKSTKAKGGPGGGAARSKSNSAAPKDAARRGSASPPDESRPPPGAANVAVPMPSAGARGRSPRSQEGASDAQCRSGSVDGGSGAEVGECLAAGDGEGAVNAVANVAAVEDIAGVGGSLPPAAAALDAGPGAATAVAADVGATTVATPTAAGRRAAEGAGSPVRDAGSNDGGSNGVAAAQPHSQALPGQAKVVTPRWKQSVDDPFAHTWLHDLSEFPDELVPMRLRRQAKVIVRNGTVEEWLAMTAPLQDAGEGGLPEMLLFLDRFPYGADRSEVDCLRRRWLSVVFPGASQFEDADAPPPEACSAGPRSADAPGSADAGGRGSGV